MGKLRYLFRNINLLNIALIAAIVLLANYTVLPLFSVNIKYALPAPKKTIVDKEEEPAQSQTPSPLDYTIVAEQNLFHPERRIPPEKKEERPKPEFVLHGTLITDDIKVAYMEDRKSPRTTPGRGKRQSVLSPGDTLSGYTLSEIHHDKVVLIRGEDRVEVSVLDNKTKARAVETGAPGQTPPAAPSRLPKDKPAGAGRPPGIVHDSPPPQGVQAPVEKELSKVKEAFDSVIKKKLDGK